MMLHHHMHLPWDRGMQPPLQHMHHLQLDTMDGYPQHMPFLICHPVSVSVKMYEIHKYKKVVSVEDFFCLGWERCC